MFDIDQVQAQEDISDYSNVQKQKSHIRELLNDNDQFS